MRVISGEKKGHRLKAPKGNDTRPTEDKIKESLFNIIRPIKNDAVVLDLFAGSGSIGIEFLSRGASKAYFVDLSSKSIAIIKENLDHTKLEDRSVVLKKDASRALNIFRDDNIKFDYVYLDPPYINVDLLKKTLKQLASYNLIAENGLLIIEHKKELELEDVLFDTFIKYDFRNYGSKSISFYKLGVLGHESDLSR